MQASASYITRSRHGNIWYYRWVVPARLRQLYPQLPRELKRSTGTADTRKARLLARRLHCALWSKLHDPRTMSHPEKFDFRALTIKLDPTSGRVVELQAEPGESEEALVAYERLMRMQSIIDREIGRTAEPPAKEQAPVERRGPSEEVTLLTASEKYIALQLATGVWSPQTAKYTHEPSIRLFRELVGRPSHRCDSEGEIREVIDLPVRELGVSQIERFLTEFRQYPEQQGKRTRHVTARQVLDVGGMPQSGANFFKRLEHIKQFLEFCVAKNYLSQQVVAEVKLVLGKDTKRRRQNEMKAKAATDGVISDGYVAFTPQELSKLFGPAFEENVNGRPARYWIPLIGLYTGMRIGEISQLQPTDFELEGTPCVSVRSHAPSTSVEDLNEPKRRVKTLASIRTVPLHPKLIELGLLEYVRGRLRQSQRWMWDDLRWSEKDGFGKYPSRDFQGLSKAAGVYVPRRKVFHSFRSTLSQALEAAGLELELIDRFIGHEVATTRVRNYGRTNAGAAFPMQRVSNALAKVSFPIQPSGWNSCTSTASP